MIYLQPEVRSGLGEDTFWTWFHREIPNTTFDPVRTVSSEDKILRYSTLGGTSFPEHTVALLWELYPEMAKMFPNINYSDKLMKIYDAARTAKKAVVASELMLNYYNRTNIDILPIGVDTSLFCPLPDRQVLREKHSIPDKKTAIWVGTSHPMKGYDLLLEWSAEHTNIQIIAVWKNRRDVLLDGDFIHRAAISQIELNELFACSNWFISSSRLAPYYMVEWEAMAANLPVWNISGIIKDFIPSSDPRNDIFSRGWDRPTALKTWLQYLT